MTEKISNPEGSSLAAETSHGLPYDPQAREQRLVVARAQRDKVLKERAAQQRQSTDAKPPKAPKDAGEPETPPSGASRQRPTDRSALWQANGSLVQAASKQNDPVLMRTKSRRWTFAVGVIVGFVTGLSVATVGAMSFGFEDLRNRVEPLLSPSGLSPSDVAPTVTTALKPLNLFAVQSSEDSITIPSTSVPPVLALTPGAALARPPSPAPHLIGYSALEDAGRPRISSAPPTFNGLRVYRSQTIATPATDTAFAHAGPNSFLFSTQTDAEPPSLPFIQEEAGRPPDRPPSRVAVYTPARQLSNRNAYSLARLTESGWAVEQATTPHRIRETHVRYYHDKDLTAARKLAGLLGTSARDFTGISPSPVEGYLEVWLRGEGIPSDARHELSPRVAPATPSSSTGAISSGSIIRSNKDATDTVSAPSSSGRSSGSSGSLSSESSGGGSSSTGAGSVAGNGIAAGGNRGSDSTASSGRRGGGVSSDGKGGSSGNGNSGASNGGNGGAKGGGGNSVGGNNGGGNGGGHRGGGNRGGGGGGGKNGDGGSDGGSGKSNSGNGGGGRRG